MRNRDNIKLSELKKNIFKMKNIVNLKKWYIELLNLNQIEFWNKSKSKDGMRMNFEICESNLNRRREYDVHEVFN